MFLIVDCHSKIMTQGFQMRSQPLYICPALWPRYGCEEINSHSFKCSRRLRAHGESFLPPTQETSFNKKAQHTVFEGRCGGGRVIPLTTKNHMHIHVCASNYKRAAGDWLALIIASIVLSFYEWQSSKGEKKGLCQGSWLSHKAFEVSPLRTTPLLQQSYDCLKSKLVLCLCWQITSQWHNSDYGSNKGGGLWGSMGEVRLLDPFFWDFKQVTECLKAILPICIIRHPVSLLLKRLFQSQFYNPGCLFPPGSNSLHPWWSDMGLHALLERPGEVRVLRGGLGVVGWGGGRCLAVFVELHVAVRLTVAADTAVTLRVDKRAWVAERAALELPLAQLNGATAHAQHEALTVVVKAVRSCSQSGVDVSEGHPRGHPLLA